jgi:hypothetical protein
LTAAVAVPLLLCGGCGSEVDAASTGAKQSDEAPTATPTQSLPTQSYEDSPTPNPEPSKAENAPPPPANLSYTGAVISLPIGEFSPDTISTDMLSGGWVAVDKGGCPWVITLDGQTHRLAGRPGAYVTGSDHASLVLPTDGSTEVTVPLGGLAAGRGVLVPAHKLKERGPCAPEGSRVMLVAPNP